MSVVRASHRYPVPTDPNGIPDASYVEHVRDRVRDTFARELVAALGRGAIVGPVHEDEQIMDDWLWNSGTKTVTFTVYAHLTELPHPEEYRMVGGPADGTIARTGGARTWRIPYLPAVSVQDNPYDAPTTVNLQYAEYEREGDTPVYLFRRIAA